MDVTPARRQRRTIVKPIEKTPEELAEAIFHDSYRDLLLTARNDRSTKGLDTDRESAMRFLAFHGEELTPKEELKIQYFIILMNDELRRRGTR